MSITFEEYARKIVKDISDRALTEEEISEFIQSSKAAEFLPEPMWGETVAPYAGIFSVEILFVMHIKAAWTEFEADREPSSS